MSDNCGVVNPADGLRCEAEVGHDGKHTHWIGPGAVSYWASDPEPKHDDALWWSTYNAALNGLIASNTSPEGARAYRHCMAAEAADEAHGFTPANVSNYEAGK